MSELLDRLRMRSLIMGAGTAANLRDENRAYPDLAAVRGTPRVEPILQAM